MKAQRKAGQFDKSDERILGDGGFVEEVLAAAREQMERKSQLRARGVDLEAVAARVSAVLKLEAGQIERPGKERRLVRARSLYCYWAVRELGIGLSDLARKFRLSSTAVSLSVKRGEKLAEAKGFRLLGGAKIRQPAAAG